MMSRTVSVIVPCLNEAGHIEQLLEAVRLQDHPPQEVIVVDGGSIDGTVDLIARFARTHPELGLRLLVEPPGLIAASVNAGVAVATGDVVARLDAHSCPRPDYLRRVVGLLSTPRAGVTGGRWEIVPGGRGGVGQAIAWAVQHPLGAGDAAYRVGSSDDSVRDVDTVPFGCFERSLWASLGGFNERLAANEDYEFNYRVRRAGRRVLFDPGAVVTYVARGTLGTLARQYFRYGWWKMQMLRHHPRALRWRQAIPVLFVLSVGLLGTAATASAGARPWLLTLLAAYGTVVGIVTVRIARRQRAWWAIAAMAVAFSVIHLAWAGGALVNLLFFGRWPTWKQVRT